MPICGPKLSLCCTLLSLWGIIQLAFMGIFFYIKSVALVEDLPLKEKYDTVDELITHVDNAYSQNAYNCWIAACLYVGTLLISGQQYWANNKSSTASF